MNTQRNRQDGFTLVEIAIVLLIVSILVGYTVAMFPRQQELKQFRAAHADMDEVLEAIIGFAQVNGRLPCPATPDSLGLENGGGTGDCVSYAGFVPANTLGLDGQVNQDGLLLDPWGNVYRYYVSPTDADGDNAEDFVNNNEMRQVGLGDVFAPSGFGYPDLDGIYLICDSDGDDNDDECDGAVEVFGRYSANGFGGAPVVLLSPGPNWDQPQPADPASGGAAGDELANIGASYSLTDLGIPVGPSGLEYTLKNIAAPQTTFVRRPTGWADDFDDIVKWISPQILFSRMIQADQLP